MLQSGMSENLWSIRKFNLTESHLPISLMKPSKSNPLFDDGRFLCGGALLTEIFGITAAHCMFKDSYDTMFKSLAGKHDLSQTEVNEQSWALSYDQIVSILRTWWV